MEVFRFMSKNELNKLIKGNKLENTIIHLGKTNSIGFCFLDLNEYKPEEAIHFLSGIVNAEVCVKFKMKKKLNKTNGTYAKHKALEGLLINKSFLEMILDIKNTETFVANEYCTTEYSLDDVEILSYAIPIWGIDEWNWQSVKDMTTI